MFKDKPKDDGFNCEKCKLFLKCESPKMEPYGEFRKHVMVIGEAPGQHEDRQGRPWQGPTGRLLRDTLGRYGLDLFRDCVSLNAVNCHPPRNATPHATQIKCCRNVKVLPALEQYKPDMIIPLGGPAIVSLLGERWRKNLGGVFKWRGWTIPDRALKAWICPTFHPSYVARMEKYREVETVWRQDLKQAVDLIGQPLSRWRRPKITYLEDDLSPLNEIRGGMVAFDYETTGLKPHATGHRIVCASVAVDEDRVFVFPVTEDKRRLEPFIKLLTNPDVEKIASNMKFEDHWTAEIFGVQVANWIWDTLLAAHTLDNRRGIAGLKFQTYVRMGKLGYEADVSSYIEAKRANDLNKIDELWDQPDGARKLMEYCALDSVFEYRLALIQMKEIEPDFLPF